MKATAIDTAHGVLDAVRFARMVGAAVHELPAACTQALTDHDLGYEVLVGSARETQLLRALRGSEAADLVASGPHRAADWERGWNENLQELQSGGDDLAVLVPKYNRHLVLRLGGDYVRANAPGFEYAVYTALRHWYFTKYFAGLDRVVELGCGTGTSLVLLAQQFPQLRLCGLDWAESSQRILAHLSALAGRSIEGRRFDMFTPGEVELGRGTGVLTSAALEQIGDRHGPLLERLLAGAPSICLHIEPLLELYDEQSLFDDVARRYHRRRGYLSGFLPRLRELAAQGRIEILEERRTGLGSFFHEGYGVVVWRPLPVRGRA